MNILAMCASYELWKVGSRELKKMLGLLLIKSNRCDYRVSFPFRNNSYATQWKLVKNWKGKADIHTNKLIFLYVKVLDMLEHYKPLFGVNWNYHFYTWMHLYSIRVDINVHTYICLPAYFGIKCRGFSFFPTWNLNRFYHQILK